MTATSSDIQQISQQVQAASQPFQQLRSHIHQVVVGQDDLLTKMMIGMLANGHLLIEGVPGLAKTLAVSCLAKGVDTGFQRIQFTPDLLPADLIGTLIYRPNDSQFVVNKGPIFSNIILADEINRIIPLRLVAGYFAFLNDSIQKTQFCSGIFLCHGPPPLLSWSIFGRCFRFFEFF